jgi:hypothetical protein
VIRGFMAEGNTNLISGVHITPHLYFVADDRETIRSSIDLRIRLYLQRSAIGAIGEPILETERGARCLR